MFHLHVTCHLILATFKQAKNKFYQFSSSLNKDRGLPEDDSEHICLSQPCLLIQHTSLHQLIVKNTCGQVSGECVLNAQTKIQESSFGHIHLCMLFRVFLR